MIYGLQDSIHHHLLSRNANENNKNEKSLHIILHTSIDDATI